MGLDRVLDLYTCQRSDIVFLDGFDNDLVPYAEVTSGTGADIEVVATTSRMGAFACRLTCGSDGSRYALLVKDLPYPALSKWGFEVSFTYNSNITSYIFRIVLRIGTTRYDARITLTPATGVLSYADSSGVEQTIATGISLYENIYIYNVIKIVADLVNKEYLRVILNGTEYSLAALDLYLSTETEAYFVGHHVQVNGAAGENESCYVDEMIVTQNEP